MQSYLWGESFLMWWNKELFAALDLEELLPLEVLVERCIRLVRVQHRVSGGFCNIDDTTGFCQARSCIFIARKNGKCVSDALSQALKDTHWRPPLLSSQVAEKGIVGR